MHLQQHDILSIKVIKKENRFYLIVFIIYVLYGYQICLVSLGTDVSNQSLLLKWVCQWLSSKLKVEKEKNENGTRTVKIPFAVIE